MNIPDRSIVLWNLRSAYNVGAITRSVASFNIGTIYCIGTTPYPHLTNDTRLPHVANRAHQQISKVALGAEDYVAYHYLPEIDGLLENARAQGVDTLALEQTDDSRDLVTLKAPAKWMLIVGEETQGLPAPITSACNITLEISQPGPKSSLNVSVASGIALFVLTQSFVN